MLPTRSVALVFTLYLVLDFSSPFIAGAFTFNADESIEAATDPSPRLIVPPPRCMGLMMPLAADH